jgi:hypothetical protein
MSLIVANVSFAYADHSYQHSKTYDTAIGYVAAANAALPEHFYAAGGTKTCNNAFAFRDSRAGGFERIVHVGDVLPSGDPAVTAAPANFS